MEEGVVQSRALACGLGWATACSRRGASHISGGSSCQDAVLTQAGFLSGRSFLIGAVADGHGDPRYDRSESGALFAVTAAVEEIHNVLHGRARDDAFAAGSRYLKSDFPMRVRRRWRKLVEKDLAPGSVGATPGVDEVKRYGTTLIVAAVFGSQAYVAHLGDGDVVWVPDSDGLTGEAMIVTPNINRGVAGETESMIDPEAHLHFRPRVLDCSMGGYLLLSSDGLSDAHADDEQFLAFCTDLVSRFREFGEHRVSEVLPTWLDDRSKRGSGDDISLVVLRINGSRRAGASSAAGDSSSAELSNHEGDSIDASQGNAVAGRDERADRDGRENVG
jgi:serine/threonine protein phosphatase PrpC